MSKKVTHPPVSLPLAFVFAFSLPVPAVRNTSLHFLLGALGLSIIAPPTPPFSVSINFEVFNEGVQDVLSLGLHYRHPYKRTQKKIKPLHYRVEAHFYNYLVFFYLNQTASPDPAPLPLLPPCHY